MTAATINQRVNAIEGFDWSGRRAFVDALFASESTAENEATGDAGDSRRESAVRCEAEDDEAEGGSDDVEPENRSEDGETEADTETASVAAAAADGPALTALQSVRGDPDRTQTGGSSGSETHSERRERVGPTPAAATDSLEEITDQLTALTRSLEAITDRVSNCHASRAQSDVDPTRDLEPELAHKLICACLTADDISAEEELRIVRAVLFADAEPA